MKYEVHVRATAEALAASVNDAIANGWRLQGGIAISQSLKTWVDERKAYPMYETVYTFAQAMTKVEQPVVTCTWGKGAMND